MVSLQKCYEILNQNRPSYSMEEVKEIRETLHQIAEIIYQSNLKMNEKSQREKSDSI